MVLTIHYPANEAEWFAKGTAEGGIYFEVPATFDANGECDTQATMQSVTQFLDILGKGSA